jgi:hypothetical protein
MLKACFWIVYDAMAWIITAYPAYGVVLAMTSGFFHEEIPQLGRGKRRKRKRFRSAFWIVTQAVVLLLSWADQGRQPGRSRSEERVPSD